ncbi:MAG TPA: hypothetical protein VGG53_00055 [Mycobacterium sp.]|jgi:hypothetical protein|uniref:hypothetical protein n=1 Tax=Mycobacterium sp. TaxID=1785 RepID=UPI002F41AFEF
MTYVDEYGTVWERKTTYIGAKLDLYCPAPVAERVSTLIHTHGDHIGYQVAGSGAPELPWPPDPNAVEYGEFCHCPSCNGRMVGASVEELRNAVKAVSDKPTGNVHVHELQYLDTEHDVVVRAAQNLHYGIHRNTANHTDTYVHGQRRVEVAYDSSFEDIQTVIKVVLPLSGDEYPATIAGAVAALQLP